MKLLEFEYDGYGCYLPKDIKLDDPFWVGIKSQNYNYAIYDSENPIIDTKPTLEDAVIYASDRYYRLKDLKELYIKLGEAFEQAETRISMP